MGFMYFFFIFCFSFCARSHVDFREALPVNVHAACAVDSRDRRSVDTRVLVVPTSRGGSRFILLADIVVLLQVIIYTGIPQAPWWASVFFPFCFFVFGRVFVWGPARAEGRGCCMSGRLFKSAL